MTTELEAEVLRLRQRIEDLESEQQPPGDMRPSERIQALERALQLAKQDAYDWEARYRVMAQKVREVAALFAEPKEAKA